MTGSTGAGWGGSFVVARPGSAMAVRTLAAGWLYRSVASARPWRRPSPWVRPSSPHFYNLNANDVTAHRLSRDARGAVVWKQPLTSWPRATFGKWCSVVAGEDLHWTERVFGDLWNKCSHRWTPTVMKKNTIVLLYCTR